MFTSYASPIWIVALICCVLMCIKFCRDTRTRLRIEKDRADQAEVSSNIFCECWTRALAAHSAFADASGPLVAKILAVGEAEDWMRGNETSCVFEYGEFRELIDALKNYPTEETEDVGKND